MAARTSKRYRLGNFSLDPDKQEFGSGERKIHLTNKPFQVLLYLVEHRGRMVSRGELLDQFWQGQEVYEETLTKCVGAIRRALDDQRGHPRYIETRYGTGYRYIGPVEEQIVREETPAVEIMQTRGLKVVIEEEEIQQEMPANEISPVRTNQLRPHFKTVAACCLSAAS